MNKFLYRRPARRLPRVLPFALVVVAFALMMAPTLQIKLNHDSQSGHAGTAASAPKSVTGFVYDSSGQKVQGATVTVNMKDSGGTIRHTEVYSPTGASGFYLVTFAPADWDVGNTIEVIAAKGSDQGTNTTVADSTDTQFVDVHFPSSIPEFGNSAIVVSATMVLLVLLAFRRRGLSTS